MMKKIIILTCTLIGIMTVIAGCATTYQKPASSTTTSTTAPTYDNPEGTTTKSTTTTSY